MRMWVVAPCVLGVLSLIAAAEPLSETDTGALETYGSFLSSLPQEDMTSASRAAMQYLVAIVPESQSVRDRAFVDFLVFYTQMAHRVTESVLPSDEEEVWRRSAMGPDPHRKEIVSTSGKVISHDYYPGVIVRSDNIFAAQARIVSTPALAELLRRNGFAWESDAEGGLYLVHDKDFVPGIFLPYISRSLKEYVLLRQREVESILAADGEICLSAEELGRRVWAWENYLAGFPNSLLKNSAMYMHKAYLGTFVKLDFYHQPDSKTGETGEFASAWSRYVKEHPGLKSSELVGKYLELLRANGFVKAFYDETAGEWKLVQQYLDFDKEFEAYLGTFGDGPSGQCLMEGAFLPDHYDIPRQKRSTDAG